MGGRLDATRSRSVASRDPELRGASRPPSAAERDHAAVGRPRGREITERVARQRTQPASVRADDVDLVLFAEPPYRASIRRERDERAVRRPRWLEVVVRAARDPTKVGPVRVDDGEVASSPSSCDGVLEDDATSVRRPRRLFGDDGTVCQPPCVRAICGRNDETLTAIGERDPGAVWRPGRRPARQGAELADLGADRVEPVQAVARERQGDAVAREGNPAVLGGGVTRRGRRTRRVDECQPESQSRTSERTTRE